MDAFFSILLPLGLIVLAGWITGALRLITPEGTKALSAYVYFIALPALFILSLAHTNLHHFFDVQLLVTLLVPQLILIALWLFLHRHTLTLPHTGIMAMACIFSNTGYLGVPLMELAYGPQGRDPALLATIINGVIVMPIIIIIVSIFQRMTPHNTQRPPLQHALHLAKIVVLSILSSPLVIAGLFGIILSLGPILLPSTAITALELVGRTAGPCALFSIGLFLATQRSILWPRLETLTTTSVKLMLYPLMAFGIGAGVFDLDSFRLGSAVILAALPTGALVFVLAERHGVAMSASATQIFWSTLLCIPTLTLLLALLGIPR